jgi:hypothetical protein
MKLFASYVLYTMDGGSWVRLPHVKGLFVPVLLPDTIGCRNPLGKLLAPDYLANNREWCPV